MGFEFSILIHPPGVSSLPSSINEYILIRFDTIKSKLDLGYENNTFHFPFKGCHFQQYAYD